MADPVVHLTLYGRPDCHLCQDMAASLDELSQDLGVTFSVVDVDADPDLAARFGPLVPVLALGDEILCQFFLDLPALRSRLETRRAPRT